MKLSIIIPTKDRGNVFSETLSRAIAASQHVGAEIIVVNDSKLSKPILSGDQARVRLINNVGAGVASARNTGAMESKGDLLLFLDDDVLISKQSIDHILVLHEKYVNACFNLNWIYPPTLSRDLERTQFGRFLKSHQLNSFKGWYADSSWKDNSLFLSKSVASFHLSVLKADFKKTNGYNEQFPHAGFEDFDFPLRLKQAGLAFYIDSRVTVHHNEADRLSLEVWLNSQERRSITRRVAVNLGHQELKLEYGFFKMTLLKVLNLGFRPLLVSLRMIPNYRIFDFAYFKLVAVLQACKIFKGYNISQG